MKVDYVHIFYDISDIVYSLASQRHSGIGRVERAWLSRVANGKVKAHYVFERQGRTVILGPAAGEILVQWERLGRASSMPILSRVALKIGRNRFALRRALMKQAVARPSKDWAKVGKVLSKVAGPDSWFLSVSQRGVRAGLHAAIERAGIRSAQLIHDTIPLDFPEYCLPGAKNHMEKFVAFLARECDLVLCNSQVTADDFARHAHRINGWPPKGEVIVAHLGVNLTEAVEGGRLPPAIALGKPFFLVLGTIEGRKQHEFLLDVWEEMARRLPREEIPQLVIAGRWGWKIDKFRQRLAASALNGFVIHVVEKPDDSSVATMMSKANALLIPSMAEGYGLPVIEAVQWGIPVIANDLPVYREFVGDYPTYIPISDINGWVTHILCSSGVRTRRTVPAVTSWEEHFSKVIGQMNAIAKASHLMA
ncbi:glycosyltransferase family 4 protein [Thioclava sp. 15-R06ZXC-3]|uniref:Glycosyltransferase family 4 protein n=1 Tax=Thioclava arctica TaxID=3238301 RepID=A0ABV3TRQ9_9RHOB